MPDRIVRAGILTSDPVNKLSWAAEVFYRRLMSVADDYGRYDGRPPILRAHLYPLKLDRVADSDVGKWLTECVTAGLVRVYTDNERPIIEIVKFDQRLRATKSKWELPPSSADSRGQPPAPDGHPPSSATDTDSDTDSESNSEKRGRAGARFAPPSVDEVRQYCQERHNTVDPQRFVDHYTANGWKVGRNAMKDWRASVRTWEGRDRPGDPPRKGKLKRALETLNERTGTGGPSRLGHDAGPQSGKLPGSG